MIKKIDCTDCVELIVLSSRSDNESVNETVVENIEENIDEILKVADQPVDSLGKRSVKDLKSMAVDLSIDTSCCIEKADIVKLVHSKLPSTSAEKCNSKRSHKQTI